MKVIVFAASLLTLLPGLARAQNQRSDYWEKHAQRENERERERIQDQTRQPNKPFSPMTVDKQAVEQLVQGWQNQKKWYAEQEQQRAAYAQQARAKREAAERAETTRRNDYFNQQRARYQGTLPVAEREELYRLGYFYYTSGQQGSTAYQPAAVAAYTAFFRDSATAAYPELAALAERVRVAFPSVARTCYRTLARRFPAQRAQVEADELLGLAFFFGALRPDLHPYLAAYPASQYEAAPASERTALLDRFETLARAHPALASPAAGLCRPHINPYAELGARWQQRGQLDSAAVCYFRALRTSHDPDTRPNLAAHNETYWHNYADVRLRPVARWLVQQRPQEVRRLSPDDWQRIAETQALPVDLLAWVFREDDFDPEDLDMPPYWRRFPALKQARSRAK